MSMTPKEQYEQRRKEQMNEKEQEERYRQLAKDATLVALNGVVAFFTGRAALNVVHFEQHVEGKHPIRGHSIRFQIDPPSKQETNQ